MEHPLYVNRKGWVPALELEHGDLIDGKFYNALGIAIDEGYIEDELGTQGSGIFSSEFIQGFAQELVRDLMLRVAGSATGVGGVVTIGLSIKDAAEIFAEMIEAYYEIRDAYTEEMLDEAAKVLAEKIAAILIEKAMDKAIDGGSRLGSRLADNLPTTTIAKPITVGESTPNVDTSTNTANNVPEANGNAGEIPGDAQANGNGNANGGFQAGQNQGGKPNSPLLPPARDNDNELETLNTYRGGNNLKARLGIDVKAGADGLIHPLGKNGKPQGLSLNVDPKNKFIQQYGGAFPVIQLPDGLQIVQSGSPGHYVISPTKPMSFEQYQGLLDQVQLGTFNSPLKNSQNLTNFPLVCFPLLSSSQVYSDESGTTEISTAAGTVCSHSGVAENSSACVLRTLKPVAGRA